MGGWVGTWVNDLSTYLVVEHEHDPAGEDNHARVDVALVGVPFLAFLQHPNQALDTHVRLHDLGRRDDNKGEVHGELEG